MMMSERMWRMTAEHSMWRPGYTYGASANDSNNGYAIGIDIPNIIISAMFPLLFLRLPGIIFVIFL